MRDNRGIWIWEFGDEVEKTSILKSVGRFNPKNGVLEIYLNYYSDDRFSPLKSQCKVGKALMNLFGGRRFICVIESSKLIKGRGGRTMTKVACYTKLPKRPTAYKMNRVRGTVKRNLVQQVFEWVDKEGNTGIMTAKEIRKTYPPDALTRIVDNPRPNKYKKEAVTYGRVWKEI